MDEHEMMAFELSVVLSNAKAQYPRVERYEEALIKSIDNHRSLSKTYRSRVRITED